MQVLEVFLDARRAWIVGALEAAAEKGPLPVHELSDTLAHVPAQMQVNLNTPCGPAGYLAMHSATEMLA